MRALKHKFLFIHGYTASSSADFYPKLIPLLEKSGIDCVIPDLPGEQHPHINEWHNTIHNTIHNAIKNNVKPLVIIGHSLGTRAALLYIEKYQQKVDYLFLIAAFANRLENARRRNENYADFFSHLIDTEKINSLVNHAYVLHSKDDHSIPFEQGKEISRDLNAELIVSEDRDHFCEPSNALYIYSVLKAKIGF